MKTLKYFVLGIIIVIIIFSCGSRTSRINQQQSVVLQSTGSTDKSQLSSSKEIISTRLKAIYINDFSITQDNEKSQLIISLSDTLNVSDFSDLFTQRGEVYFSQSTDNQSVWSKLKKLDSRLLLADNTSAETMLSMIQSNPELHHSPAVIGLVNARDTALVSKCLKSESIKSLLPEVRFAWGKWADSAQHYQLYALNVQTSIDGRLIKEASVSTSGSFDIEIKLSFNSEGSSLWKDLTTKSIGKPVAMIINGKVYSAPIVRSVINNGNCIITGNYTGMEANNLVAMIKSGALPVSFKLVK
jgi:Preprotein translocase subunit SecD